MIGEDRGSPGVFVAELGGCFSGLHGVSGRTDCVLASFLPTSDLVISSITTVSFPRGARSASVPFSSVVTPSAWNPRGGGRHCFFRGGGRTFVTGFGRCIFFRISARTKRLSKPTAGCPLYTSDAADEKRGEDLAGHRTIIKKHLCLIYI